MVPRGRVELPRVAPLAPKASASASSATSALLYCSMPVSDSARKFDKQLFLC